MNCEDCRELVELLRDESNCDVLDYIDDAATAIETLLAERDALMMDLIDSYMNRGNACRSCKHAPCSPKHDGCIGWQWRGPCMAERGIS